MANPKTFRRLGKTFLLVAVLAFLAGFLVTVVGMTNTFRQISQTDDFAEVAVEQAVEKTVSLSLRTNAIGIPVGLTCLVAGICCYVVAARLNRQTGAQNGEIPAA
ncbi:hypothetical protein Pan258_55090 [Symmachiella dynata]|uniref:MotA/TolQ/ExbB proton channel family protein n=1 Tax=Symmachiella dynata TaxID=2527995 RepID=UPI00118A6332|nr:MotA/TolQ/ExbB proton channel family protein [Symmachiella dynata]QDT51420.1 hypothetical protein Pan258_55090 [Symmachiella dynata]